MRWKILDNPFRIIRSNTAFTLIELLIVIGIISILSALAIPSLLNPENKLKKVVREMVGDMQKTRSMAIKTMLSRLVAKGAVSESKRGNTSVYEPLISRRKARRTAVGRLLTTAFDGSIQPLVSFLADDIRLSVEQRRELIAILESERGADEEEQ